MTAEMPQGCLVKGAARGAHVRLSATRILNRMHTSLSTRFGVGMPERAAGGDEDAAPFMARSIDASSAVAALDADGDGVVSSADLASKASGVLGFDVSLSAAASLVSEVCRVSASSPDDEVPTRQGFSAQHLSTWFEGELAHKAVIPVACFADLRESLEAARTHPGGAGFVVVEVTSDSCRACRKFERSYERVAARFRDRATFLRLQTGMGKGRAAAAVCEWLKVDVTPTAVFFRGKEEVSRFTGSDVMRFEKQLAEVLERADGIFAEDCSHATIAT